MNKQTKKNAISNNDATVFDFLSEAEAEKYKDALKIVNEANETAKWVDDYMKQFLENNYFEYYPQDFITKIRQCVIALKRKGHLREDPYNSFYNSELSKRIKIEKTYSIDTSDLE